MTPADFIAARRAMGLTQRALAERLGVSTRAVQHWEAGTRPVPRYAERAMTTDTGPRAWSLLVGHALPSDIKPHCVYTSFGVEYVLLAQGGICAAFEVEPLLEKSPADAVELITSTLRRLQVRVIQTTCAGNEQRD